MALLLGSAQVIPVRESLGNVFVAVVPHIQVIILMEEGKNQNRSEIIMWIKVTIYGLLLILFKILNYQQCVAKHGSAVQQMMTVNQTFVHHGGPLCSAQGHVKHR